MKSLSSIVLILAAICLTRSAAPYPWDQDMVDQPSEKPQESAAPLAPARSVPITGGETLPAPTTEEGVFEADKAAALLVNPVPATAESIERGAYFYDINCAVCHGAEGLGNGLVGLKFEPAPVDLNAAYTQDQADGQLFFTLTRGRGAMPFYRDALSPDERWDVVNYVKHKFGDK